MPAGGRVILIIGSTIMPALRLGSMRIPATCKDSGKASLYSVMSNAIQYHDTLGNLVSCTIKRKINIAQVSLCNYGNSPSVSGPTCIDNQSSCVSSYCGDGNTIGCIYALTPIPLYGGLVWQTGIRRITTSGNTISWVDWGDGVYSGTLAVIPGHNVSGGFWDCGYPGCIGRMQGEGNQIIFEQCNAIDYICLQSNFDGGCDLIGVNHFTCNEVARVDVEDAIIKNVSNNPCALQYYMGMGPIWNSGNSILYGDANNPCGVALYTGKCQYPASLIDEIQESIDDQCLVLEQEANCKAEDEKVDNIYTLKNYTPTGLIPLATCKDFIGNYDHNICRDWWEKDRTYLCQNAAKFDLTDAMQRVRSIDQTTQESNGLASYTDYRQDSASQQWITEGNTFDLGVARNQPYISCSNVCKTRKPKEDSQASQTGVTSQYRKDVTTYDFYYRQCYPSTTTCPAGAGEEILKDCQCINEFAETFTLLESLKEAGKDSICSSGVKQ